MNGVKIPNDFCKLLNMLLGDCHYFATLEEGCDLAHKIILTELVSFYKLRMKQLVFYN